MIHKPSIHTPYNPRAALHTKSQRLPLSFSCGVYFPRGESQVSKGDGKEIKVGWMREEGSREVRQGKKGRRWKRWRGDGRFLVALRPLPLVQNIKMLKIKT